MKTKPLQHWNGRCYLPGKLRTRGMCIAAHSKAEAVRLVKEHMPSWSVNELNIYFSPCWGTTALKKLPFDQVGVWVELEGKRVGEENKFVTLEKAYEMIDAERKK